MAIGLFTPEEIACLECELGRRWRAKKKGERKVFQRLHRKLTGIEVSEGLSPTEKDLLQQVLEGAIFPSGERKLWAGAKLLMAHVHIPTD